MSSSSSPPSLKFVYPIDKKIQYNNDGEYRQSLRELFSMKAQTDVLNDADMDEISKDENNYDSYMAQMWSKWISEETKDCYELNELYKLAAATMISLDRDTGLAVLLSFDYFAEFHKLLVQFFICPEGDLEMCTSYERLWNRLSVKGR
jgi:hypothetical protein